MHARKLEKNITLTGAHTPYDPAIKVPRAWSSSLFSRYLARKCKPKLDTFAGKHFLYARRVCGSELYQLEAGKRAILWPVSYVTDGISFCGICAKSDEKQVVNHQWTNASTSCGSYLNVSILRVTS